MCDESLHLKGICCAQSSRAVLLFEQGFLIGSHPLAGSVAVTDNPGPFNGSFLRPGGPAAGNSPSALCRGEAVGARHGSMVPASVGALFRLPVAFSSPVFHQLTLPCPAEIFTQGSLFWPTWVQCPCVGSQNTACFSLVGFITVHISTCLFQKI